MSKTETGYKLNPFILAFSILLVSAFSTVYILTATENISTQNTQAAIVDGANNNPCAGSDYYVHFWQNEPSIYKNSEYLHGRSFALGASNQSSANFYRPPKLDGNSIFEFGNGNIQGGSDIKLQNINTAPKKVSGRITDAAGHYGNFNLHFEFNADPQFTGWSPDSVVNDPNNSNAFANDWSTFKLTKPAANIQVLGNAGGSMKIYVKCNTTGQIRTMVLRWQLILADDLIPVTTVKQTAKPTNSPGKTNVPAPTVETTQTKTPTPTTVPTSLFDPNDDKTAKCKERCGINAGKYNCSYSSNVGDCVAETTNGCKKLVGNNNTEFNFNNEKSEYKYPKKFDFRCKNPDYDPCTDKYSTPDIFTVGYNSENIPQCDGKTIAACTTLLGDKNQYEVVNNSCKVIQPDQKVDMKLSAECSAVSSNTSALVALIDAKNRNGVRSWAKSLNLATLNTTVSCLNPDQKNGLVETIYSGNAKGAIRDKFTQIMRYILDNQDLGFYAEVWSYTTLNSEGDRLTYYPSENIIRLAPSIFNENTTLEYGRDVLMHESFHSFNANNGGPGGGHAGSLDEGSSIWIFKFTYPGGRDSKEISSGWAESVYGSKNYFRDIGLSGSNNIQLTVANNPSQKYKDIYKIMSEKDPSGLSWNNSGKLNNCYKNYYQGINRNVDYFSVWLPATVKAADQMKNDPACNPDSNVLGESTGPTQTVSADDKPYYLTQVSEGVSYARLQPDNIKLSIEYSKYGKTLVSIPKDLEVGIYTLQFMTQSGKVFSETAVTIPEPPPADSTKNTTKTSITNKTISTGPNLLLVFIFGAAAILIINYGSFIILKEFNKRNKKHKVAA